MKYIHNKNTIYSFKYKVRLWSIISLHITDLLNLILICFKNKNLGFVFWTLVTFFSLVSNIKYHKIKSVKNPVIISIVGMFGSLVWLYYVYNIKVFAALLVAEALFIVLGFLILLGIYQYRKRIKGWYS